MPEIITQDGASLHYAVHGSGPVEMLLLHGMGGTSSTWQPVVELLDLAAVRVVTVDLRGHGKSKGGEAQFTYAQVTTDLLAIADAAAMDRPVVVGYSGSCKNVICLAAAAPQRVRGIVLVAPGGMAEVAVPRAAVNGLFDYVGREGDLPALFDPWFGKKIGAHRQTVGRDYARTSRAALDASAELWIYTSVMEHARRVAHPILVIAGTEEPIYHPAYQQQTTLATLPHAHMEVLGCAHFIPLEEPAAVTEMLMRFSGSLA
jgi:pimeloyl-ACP methyl ester carboxylesterase